MPGSNISGSTALLTTAVLFTDDWISVRNHLFLIVALFFIVAAQQQQALKAENRRL
jgi:hypothetical protein